MFSFFLVCFSRLVDAYKKLHIFSAVITYFSLCSWEFHETNIRSLLNKMSESDLSLYRFDISKLNWNDYFRVHINGIRIHILGESMDNIPNAIKRSKKSVILAFKYIRNGTRGWGNFFIVLRLTRPRQQFRLFLCRSSGSEFNMKCLRDQRHFFEFQPVMSKKIWEFNKT